MGRRTRKKLPEMHRPRMVCTRGRKVAYGTKAKARTAAARMTVGSGEKMVAYKCDVCRMWHLTHADRDKQSRVHPIGGRRFGPLEGEKPPTSNSSPPATDTGE